MESLVRAQPLRQFGSRTESAIVNGTLDGAPLSNVLITVTGRGDTTNVQDIGGFAGILTNFPIVGSFSISDGREGIFTDSLEIFEAQTPDGEPLRIQAFLEFLDTNFSPPNLPRVVLGIADMVLFGGPLASYDLATAIGPIPGFGTVGSSSSIPTTAGFLVLNNAYEATFTAAVGVSEPVIGRGLPVALALVFIGKKLLERSRRTGWRSGSPENPSSRRFGVATARFGPAST